MHEVYKIAITLPVLIFLICLVAKFAVATVIAVFVAWSYCFVCNIDPFQGITDKGIRFSLKVRNSKSNHLRSSFFSNSGPMHNTSGNSSWLRKSFPIYSPNKGNLNLNDVSRQLEPKITSTPLPDWQRRNRAYPSPRTKTPISTRYSLSDMNYSNTSLDREHSRSTAVQNTSGPLLASTHFHNNVGTYMDSKSPGLSGRLVQYNNEVEVQKATHQAKYGRPGVFPIVHLFKKDTPIISPKPRRVTVRMASAELPTYSRPNYDKLLQNGSVRDPVNIQSCPGTSEPDTGPRSVLDALKEISRKRLHNNEEELEDSQDKNKRQKKESLNTPKDPNKRTREESPPHTGNYDGGQNGSTTKRACVVDPVTASLTSFQRYLSQIEKGHKRKASLSSSTMEKPVKFQKQNVETQTREEATDVTMKQPLLIEKSTSTDDETVPKVSVDDKKAVDSEEKEQNEAPVDNINVFDEETLANNRRNKLAMLLGAITGQKPQVEHSEDRIKVFTSRHQKRPVSILSPPNKAKHNKHVHFNLPETTQNSVAYQSTGSDEIYSPEEIPKPAEVSSSTNSDDNRDDEVFAEKPAAPNGILTFGTVLPTLSVPVGLSPEKRLRVPSFSPNFTQFSVANTAVTASASISPFSPVQSSGLTAPTSLGNISTTTNAASSPPKIGGFKFDVVSSPPAATSTVPDSARNTFKPPASTSFTTDGLKTLEKPRNTQTNVSSPFKLPSSNAPVFTTNSPGSLSFEVKAPTIIMSTPPANISPFTTSSAATSFGTTLVAVTTSPGMVGSAVSNPPNFTFKMPVNTMSQNVMTTQSSFGLPNKSVSDVKTKMGITKPFPFLSDSSQTKPTPEINTFGTTTSPSIFGGTLTNTVAAAPSYAANSAPPFVVKSDSTAVPTFSTANMPNQMFGVTKSKSASIFDTTTNTNSSASKNIFGGLTTNSGTPGFGTATSVTPMFGTATTVTSSFGPVSFPTTTNVVPAFGTASFGPPATTTVAFPPFGTATNTSGALPSFNMVTTASTPVFGGNTPATTFAPMFGTTTSSSAATGFGGGMSKPPAFNTPTGGFGSISSTGISGSGFGANANGSFGAPTTTTGGFNSSTLTTGGFGSGTATTGGFGSSTTTAAGFGSGTTNAGGFGSSTTVPGGFGNGTTTAGDFGSSTVPTAGFGSSTTNAGGFGSSTTNAGGFGSSTSTTGGFGSSTTSPGGFGSSTANAGGFGVVTSTTGGFGSGSASTFGTNTAPTFGIPAGNSTGFEAPKQAAPKMFGTTAPPAFGRSTNGNKPEGSISGFGTGFGSATTTTNNNKLETVVPGFGTSFGSSTAPSPFGGTTGFGTGFGNASSANAKPQAAVNSFASPSTNAFNPSGSNMFASSSANPASSGFGAVMSQTGPAFNFGATNNTAANANSNIFSFSSGDAPQPGGFKFGKPTSAPPAFGSGTAAPPAVGTGFRLAQTIPTPGTFSIGAGSTNRTRTQLKAKRRT